MITITSSFQKSISITITVTVSSNPLQFQLIPQDYNYDYNYMQYQLTTTSHQKLEFILRNISVSKLLVSTTHVQCTTGGQYYSWRK